MDALVPCLAKQFWFLNTLVTIHRSAAESSDADRGLSVLEHQAPLHDSPPLHTHSSEDEVFIVLDGELHLRVGTTDHVATPGAVLVAPKNVPHTYRVDSAGGARWDAPRSRRACPRPADRRQRRTRQPWAEWRSSSGLSSWAHRLGPR